MKISLTISLLLYTVIALSQLQYDTKQMSPVPLAQQVDMNSLGPDFRLDMKYMEGPSQSSTKLAEIKKIMSAKYPKQYDIKAPTKRLTDPPEIITGFQSNGIDGSVPEDNHIAVSNSGEIFSVVNSNVSMRQLDGTVIRNRTLENFTGDLAPGQSKFDPRTMYDPTSDRFIFTCLAGFTSQTSSIIVGFSEEGSLNSTWNLYEFTGNPRGDNTWSDYPMISINDNELFLTLNLIRDNESWQEGFAETFIYQIDKDTGYNGEDLKIRQWSNITYDGRPIRNLCPIKYGDENLGDNQYFLSSFNFAIETDTIFIVELTDNQDEADINIDVRTADFNYGAPPVANQPSGLLETNDARILDGIFINNHIQFVGNTINHNTGFADIYHGIIEDIAGSKDIRGQLLGGSNVEYGYAGISWAGDDISDRESIIVMAHSAIDKNPGISALFYDNEEEYSDIIEIKGGDSFINNLGGNIERWGDYAGCQRKYDEPGIVWTSGTFGAINNAGITYVNALAVPGRITSTQENAIDNNITVSPNPSYNKTAVKFEALDYSNINITLLDAQGQLVKLLYNDKPKKLGLIEFSFNSNALSNGTYFVNIKIGNKALTTERVIVAK